MIDNFQGPGADARIVFIDGAFDLFHAGHVEVIFKKISLFISIDSHIFFNCYH